MRYTAKTNLRVDGRMVKPGEEFEKDYNPEQEAKLIAKGAMVKAEADAPEEVSAQPAPKAEEPQKPKRARKPKKAEEETEAEYTEPEPMKIDAMDGIVPKGKGKRKEPD